jgi:hypothetical protein
MAQFGAIRRWLRPARRCFLGRWRGKSARVFRVSMKLHGAAHPGFGADRPDPIGKGWDKAEIR